jgi:type IV pilus assembly protein PilA
MTTLNSRLQLSILNRKKGKNLIEKGFTLVELMIVIVIVGVLSAVALPNFLSQTSKAKGTEATSQASALIKESQARYLQNAAADPALTAADGTSGSCSILGAPADGDTKFNYTCGYASNKLTVTATGNTNDPAINGLAVVDEIDLQKGVITRKLGATSTEFGGTLTP